MSRFFRNLFGVSSYAPVQQRRAPAVYRPAPVASQPAAPPRPPRRPRPLYGTDRIGIVGFNDTGFVIAVPEEPFAPWLLERSQQLHEHVKGWTNMADGLRKAIDVLQRTPPGVWQKIWLLSDGYPNVDVGGITPALEAAAAAGIKINTIGFGDQYDEALLCRISQAARGRYVPVKTLRQLTEALVRATGNDAGANRRRQQAETSVLAIDLSASMTEPMEGKSKVAVVEEAVLQLLHYKQKCWS